MLLTEANDTLLVFVSIVLLDQAVEKSLTRAVCRHSKPVLLAGVFHPALTKRGQNKRTKK
jgi:hypothetical protein